MKKFINHICFLIILNFISLHYLAQTNSSNTEVNQLLNSKEDTIKVNSLIKYAFKLENTDIDSALLFYTKAKELCDKINFKTGRIRCYFNISYIYNLQGEYKKGLYVNIQSIRESNLIKNEELLGKSFFNLGASYTYLNNYPKAIKYYELATYYFNKSGNKKNLANLYNNIASCYNNASNTTKDTLLFNKAIYYYKKTIEISNEIKDTGLIISIYLNLSNTYLNSEKTKQAFDNITKAQVLAEKYNNENLRASVYQVLSTYYNSINDNNNALLYGQKGLIIIQTNGNIYEEIKCLKAIANSYLNLGQKKEAEITINRAMALCDTIESLTDKNSILMTYSKIKFVNEKYKEGYIGLFDLITITDSINSEEMKNQFTDLEAKYAGEKKELQIKNQSLEIDAKEKQNKQKSLIILFGALGLLATGVFGGLAFKNYKKTKKQNLIIENQKQQVELKNEEVIHQKELVEEKQKEIIDSINYAKRIQQAVLTGEEVWNKISKEHFILFKPKDIVSGDFYWAYNTPNGRSIFALADCTGHGVPGGFMSMLGNSFLNEIVVENKIFKANEILNKLREKVISALEQKGQTDQKDGMDISLCVWNKMDNTLEFAGANNPLWLLRTSTPLSIPEITEFKADKMPIGTYLETQQPFQSTTIQLQADDIIYLSTDGYADQFGGPKGKKFKYKPLMEMLIANHSNTMNSQKIILEEAFNTWKNKQEQVDDVAIIGIKVLS